MSDQEIPVKREIASIADQIAAGHIPIHDGIVHIVRLRGRLSGPDFYDRDLEVFIAVDSELDGFPVGETRALWAPDALEARDRARDSYLREVRDQIDQACRSLVSRWGPS